ncbi:MAG: hypothetical protein N3F63_04610 [Thermoplasmata archaeon]|nr:hypothetical protein [Thermoplasmata archaeon]
MTVYAAVLPLIAALSGLGCGLFILSGKKGGVKKHILLLLFLGFTIAYGFAVFWGMLHTDSVIFWQVAMVFLSTALLAGMFFTIQITRDIRETDSVFLLLYFMSTTGGVLSIEKTLEVSEVHLPIVSPILFGVFLIYVLIAWGEVLYNLIVARIASRKIELKRYRKKLNYLFVSLNLVFCFTCIDAAFVYAGVLLMPVVVVFLPIPTLLIFFFMFES